ncbi:hypothetical protein ACEWY4_024486 [Coilia grayii]|uniref:Reverse transcriptase domain-containing protein n=1 Tax=Coilia grayii TaxID=363190 RepID=A0ABD1J0G4_9TELE
MHVVWEVVARRVLCVDAGWRGIQLRLDYLFVSVGVVVRGFVLQPLWLSDHCLIGAQLDVGEQQRGRGPWRFNASFLGDPSFCWVFRLLYAGWRALRPMYSSLCDWWEGVKAHIATFCREWGREKVRDARRRVGRWAAELRCLWGAGSAPSAAQAERMRVLRSQLRDFYMAEARALVGLGGGNRWAQEEDPSKAFYAALRQRRSRTCLDTLRGPAGLVTDPGEVMEVARSFYADLFAQRDTGPGAAAGFLDWLGPALPELDRLSLEGDISLSEAEAAMATTQRGEGPGVRRPAGGVLPGLLGLLGADLVAVFTECSSVGRLPASMSTGLVTVLYKGRGHREDLTCWRPITLLTADYKILAKVLTLRLGRVIGLVVHPDQTCGVPGHSCALNLVLVRDVVCWSEQRGLSAALLSLDQEKAFDRVDHRFLFQVLRRMGFVPGFWGCVRLLYGGAVSRLRIGGSLFAPVAQRGGVSQGCPLSPLLYVLYIEPLVARLRGDPAFADDLTLFLTTECSFRAVVAILAAFGQAAKAKVNLAKSAVLCLGGWGARASVPWPFLVQQSVRILGLDFTRLESAQYNWNALLNKVTRTLSLWGTRPLSLSGRVLLVKSGILPRLNHVSYVFPVPFLTVDLRVCQQFVTAWEEKKGHHLLGGLNLRPLYQQDIVQLVVHMYNPLATVVAEGPHGMEAARDPPPQAPGGGALPVTLVEAAAAPVPVPDPPAAPPGDAEGEASAAEMTKLLTLSSWGDSVAPAPCGLLDCSWGPGTMELLQSAGPVATPDVPVDLLTALGEDMELEPGRVASPKRPAASSDEELARLRREPKRERREGPQVAPEDSPSGPAAVQEAPASLPEPVLAEEDGAGRAEEDHMDPPSGWSGDLPVVPDTPDEVLRGRDAALAGETAGQGSGGEVGHGTAVSPCLARLRAEIGVLRSPGSPEDLTTRLPSRRREVRVFLVVSVLRELFSLDPEEIFCFQDFSSAGFAVVTFWDLRVCQRFVTAWEEKKGHHLLGGLNLRPLHQQDVVQLVVHMYNPYVPDADVEAFLARHAVFVKGGTWLKEGTRLKDNFGIWTGKRRYAIRLRPDPARLGEFLYPPGSFSIGDDRGFLTYPAQPVYCRRCGGLGHTKATCSGSRCRFCGGEGHVADRCQAPRRCSLCGSEGHLFRSCPGRSQTYADAARPQRVVEKVAVTDAAIVSSLATVVAEGPHGVEAARDPPLQAPGGGALPVPLSPQVFYPCGGEVSVLFCVGSKWERLRKEVVKKRKENGGKGLLDLNLFLDQEEVSPVPRLTQEEAKEAWTNAAHPALQNKLKDLAWMALHEVLPVRAVMHSRGMARDPICPRLEAATPRPCARAKVNLAKSAVLCLGGWGARDSGSAVW